MTLPQSRSVPTQDDAVRVIARAVQEAAAYPDDSVAAAWLRLRCRMDGYPIDVADSRDLIRAARGRPTLHVVR